MSVKKVHLLNCLIALFGFFISLNLLNNYTHGDQIVYHIFYEKIAGLSYWDVGPVAKNVIASNEPLTWLVLWVGSNMGIQKNVWISLLNVVLMTGLFALLMRHKAPWYAVLLIFTNFYFLVLITSAERLKIAYIFLTYAFLMGSGKRYLFLLFAPLAHLQSVIFLAGLVLSALHEQIRHLIQRFKINKRLFSQSVVLALVATPLVFLLKNGIISKLNAYADAFSFSWFAFANISLLLLVATIATTNKLRMVLALSLMIFAIAVVGGDRVNMVAVTLALGILMFEQRLRHPLVLLLLLYFSFKSIPYVKNIYTFGDGFMFMSNQ
jgi:hypothetical protein